MKTKHLVAVAVIASLAMGSTQAAVSSPGTAEATIDWSTFSVTGYASGGAPLPTIIWNTPSQLTALSASTLYPDDFQSFDVSDWNSALVRNAGNTTTRASSDVNADLLRSHSYDIGSDESSAFGDVQRSSLFSVSGNGVLVFSVAYKLEASTPDTSETIDPSSSQATVSFVVKPFTPTSEIFSSEDNVTVGQWHPGSDFREGVLTLGLVVQDGQEFSFNAMAKTNAYISAVPLPQAVWLFGAGLMGLLSMAKRSRFI